MIFVISSDIDFTCTSIKAAVINASEERGTTSKVNGKFAPLSHRVFESSVALLRISHVLLYVEYIVT